MSTLQFPIANDPVCSCLLKRIQVRHTDPRQVIVVSRDDHQISYQSRGGDQSIDSRNRVRRAQPAPSFRDGLVDRDDPVAKLDDRSPQPGLQRLGGGWIPSSHTCDALAQFADCKNTQVEVFTPALTKPGNDRSIRAVTFA